MEGLIGNFLEYLKVMESDFHLMKNDEIQKEISSGNIIITSLKISKNTKIEFKISFIGKKDFCIVNLKANTGINIEIKENLRDILCKVEEINALSTYKQYSVEPSGILEINSELYVNPKDVKTIYKGMSNIIIDFQKEFEELL